MLQDHQFFRALKEEPGLDPYQAATALWQRKEGEGSIFGHTVAWASLLSTSSQEKSFSLGKPAPKVIFSFASLARNA